MPSNRPLGVLWDASVYGFRAAALVHPTRFRAAIFLVHIVGWDVVAVFVEGPAYGAILFAHEHFELARSPAALPSIVRISHAEVMFRCAEGESALGHELDVQKP